MMRLRAVKKSVRALSFRQLIMLGTWLPKLIETFERARGREAVVEYTISRRDPTRVSRRRKVVS